MVAVEKRCDHVVVRLRGRLTLHDVPRVREAAVKSLLDTGRVVIDLSGLRCRQSALVSVFPTALALAGGWPAARLVMFGATDQLRPLLANAGTPKSVPLAEDRPAARALLEQQPAHLRRHCDLTSHPGAPAVARLFVRQTCALWSLPQILEQLAELVSSELVTNAVQHADSGSRVTLTYTGSMLRVSLRDYRPTPAPWSRPINIHAPRGRGLHLVTAAVHSWGTTPHPDGTTMWVNLVNGKLLDETSR
jgi:anti-sigma regulatory factor (Ser/Thr protein kinase)